MSTFVSPNVTVLLNVLLAHHTVYTEHYKSCTLDRYRCCPCMQRTRLANRIAGAVGLLEQILKYICILNRLPYLYIYSDHIDQHFPYLVLSFFGVDMITFYSCAGIPIDTRILVSVAWSQTCAPGADSGNWTHILRLEVWCNNHYTISAWSTAVSHTRSHSGKLSAV